MALIDISELLSDPDFADDFTVIRSTRQVGDDGRTTDSPTYYYTYGVVQPGERLRDGSGLSQMTDLERAGRDIHIVTPFRLLPLTHTTAPDQVVWNGQNYRVLHTADWTNYGQGFVTAKCELIDTALDGPP